MGEKIDKKVSNYKEHEIFQEGHEGELQKAIRKYLFTEKDIKKLRAVTARRSVVDSPRCEEIIKNHPLRNYVLVGSFKHLQSALVKGQSTWPDGRDFKADDNLFEFVIKTDKPKLLKDPKFAGGNRFVFYFLKGLYDVLKESCPNCSDDVVECELCGGTKFVSGIDIANSKTGDASWARGMAIISAFDKNHDIELSTEEARTLMKHLREKDIHDL